MPTLPLKSKEPVHKGPRFINASPIEEKVEVKNEPTHTPFRSQESPAENGTLSVEKEYENRLQGRKSRLQETRRHDLLVARARMVVFFLGVGVAVAGPLWDLFSAYWGLAAVAPFVLLVALHRRVLKRKDRAEQAVAFYEGGLSRIQDRWPGRGIQRVRDAEKTHPYAVDLDIFGEHSLFERLCTARTDFGEHTLSRWLLEPAPMEEVHQRQSAVTSLKGDLDSREELFVTSGGMGAEIEKSVFQKWLSTPPPYPSSWAALFRAAAFAMTLCTLSTAVLWGWTSIGPLPFAAAVILQLLGLAVAKRWVSVSLSGLDRPEKGLRTLSRLLSLLESTDYPDDKLRSLKENLVTRDVNASHSVAKLSRLVNWIESKNNMFFGPAWFALSLTIHSSLAVERWRRIYGTQVMTWLDTVGEWEALFSLATYAFENPGYPFPELSKGEAPSFKAEALGHPLLPDETCVRNDVELDDSIPVWIVSGSNMSGKSTLLRAVGLNTVLAMAGAPVRAKSLSLTPLQVGATIRIEDSLQGGSSRFYEEIKRLKQLMDLAVGAPPLLFLLDEILHGTNSQDRREGAKAVVSQLIKRGCVGLVTTHDLGVADAAEKEEGLLKNVHFTDDVHDGKLFFDYKLREGVVDKSNALELMRAVGLEV